MLAETATVKAQEETTNRSYGNRLKLASCCVTDEVTIKFKCCRGKVAYAKIAMDRRLCMDNVLNDRS